MFNIIHNLLHSDLKCSRPFCVREKRRRFNLEILDNELRVGLIDQATYEEAKRGDLTSKYLTIEAATIDAFIRA